MDRQIYIDLMLENENLTSNLTDELANILLNWGVAQVDVLLDGVVDQDQADMRFSGLVRFMRSINRLISRLPEIIDEDLSTLLERYRIAFGESHEADEIECSNIAQMISVMDPLDVINFLLTWVKPTPPQS